MRARRRARLARAARRSRAAAGGAGRRSAASTAAASPPSRRSAASSSTSCTRRPRWPSGSSPSRPTSPPRRTSAAGSTRPASGRSATGSTGSPTTPTRSCAGARPTTASTSSSASPRSTWSACSASSARPGRATASRCCRSARSTTRSWRRALEPWSFGIYAGGQSILVGTPSGVTLGPEGGAHQSIDHAVDRHRAAGLRRLGARLRPGPRVDAPARAVAARPAGRRRRPTSGCRRARSTRRWHGAATRDGACSPAATGCARADGARGDARRRWARSCPRRSRPPTCSDEAGVDAEVVCVTSADLLFRALPGPRRARRRRPGDPRRAVPGRRAPIVTRARRPPARARLPGGVNAVPLTCLGVQRFGQSGDLDELYGHHEIDAESIVGAALDLL